ncbi:BlaI/MecI/CopY family transcriptional regulator [Conexibacter sp. DBS9H8]|uniref:BlaI/MecI/CopY family transcriptional regulator n=1 Tax=Conexibacter sp. DBS9H8 TaxID=2937801 RepID=UPI00200BEF52|nr:BlaI/MecI/CopY family transcriptional regulator [Conexibacter sp. DBS9H8]
MSEGRRYVCGHRLPALEADVLELLLAAAGPMTVTEVQGALTGAPRAHTTVSTLLTRLRERGLVTRELRDRVYAWAPAASAQELTIAALEQILDGVDDPDAVVLGFLDTVRGRRARRPRH